MKRLLHKTFLFLAILIAIKLVSLLFCKDELAYCRSHFAEQDFNTVFIGSSRTKKAIIPAYFDSLTQKQTTSYNFGINGALPPRTFDWCAELIKSKPSLKYMFIELSGADSDLVYKKSWRDFSLYYDKLLVSLLRPDIMGDYDDNNGPFPTALEKRDATREHIPSEILQLSHTRNLRVETDSSLSLTLNGAFWARVCDLIELANSRGIHIYFFIPPRLVTEGELEMIYPIYQRLPTKYKLNAMHYDETLYQDDTSLDEFHLNHKGALRFTEILYRAFDNQDL